MKQPSAIRLLSSTNNARGDLFTRLVKDLFFALGYENLRLDVHKSGCEIDIQGAHRHEPKHMIAECKAHADKIGGADLNKFFGILARERDKRSPAPVSGYFVSLSGFRETGKEQELGTNEQSRLILIDGKQAVEELQRSRVLVTHEEAIKQAGCCIKQAGLDSPLGEVELLGHEIGYVWIIYFTQGKKNTEFALIHADGTPLAESIAQEIIASDQDAGGQMHTLRYLAPPLPASDRPKVSKVATERYCQWIVEECGCIQLDGLPADTDLSATRLKLEQLFVPLKVVVKSEENSKRKGDDYDDNEVIEPLGSFLDSHPHIALLAAPGGGKSTLLKRLATAYADPVRRAEVDDALPERNWLPLFVRCRELQDQVRRPILELLDELTLHAGMNGEERAVFSERIHESLRNGQALLLVDGLDEISEEGDRQVFAQHLRTFLGMFPRVSLVVTSREAGFRHVAGVLAGGCEQVRLANFDGSDVQRLCESWHVVVVGDNDKVRADAQELARAIWDNRRIRSLVENPLLLTTLLIVKRWVGELPRNRVELYRRAIEVLIRTWNVEGYEPLDEDETLAQLSYVACEMMKRGDQQIGHADLIKLLQNARQELEAELQFTAISASKFIERIEYRSSVLMQTGHERVDGVLQAVYEFRHLTFQEYLAARGFVQEQYSGRNEGYELADLLEPYFTDESWYEVIPLTVVLAGRKSESIMKRLVAECDKFKQSDSAHRELGMSQSHLLMQCLLDEVQIPSITLRAAFKQVGRHVNESSVHTVKAGSNFIKLRRGKYGVLLQEVIESCYFDGKDGWDEYYVAIEQLCAEKMNFRIDEGMTDEKVETLDTLFRSKDRKERAAGAFACMSMAFLLTTSEEKSEHSTHKYYQKLYPLICEMLDPSDLPLALSACWALAWIGASETCSTSMDSSVALQLYRFWRNSLSKEFGRFAAWAFTTQPFLKRDEFGQSDWGECDKFLRHEASKDADRMRKRAALLVAWYRRAPWNDAELANLAGKILKTEVIRVQRWDKVPVMLLENLGDDGAILLQEWRDKQDKKKRILAVKRIEQS